MPACCFQAFLKTIHPYTLLLGNVFVAGGYSTSSNTDTVEMYDGSRWASAPSLPYAVASAGAAMWSNKLYVV